MDNNSVPITPEQQLRTICLLQKVELQELATAAGISTDTLRDRMRRGKWRISEADQIAKKLRLTKVQYDSIFRHPDPGE